jgi:hypothetical protein
MVHIIFKSGFGSALEWKLDPDLHLSQNSEDLQIQIEPWRVYRPDVADFHQEQDPDADLATYYSEKLYPEPN